MAEIMLSLVSGLIGALIATFLTIGYTEYKDKKKQKLSLAREKLEKVYAPLVALKKKIDLVNKNDGGFLLPSNPLEVEMIEKIIFHYYHLLDEDLREDLPLLHTQLRHDIVSRIKSPEMVDKINKHYKENKEILGLK